MSYENIILLLIFMGEMATKLYNDLEKDVILYMLYHSHNIFCNEINSKG